MQFLIDRNVPEALARMLGHFDKAHTVYWLDDKFDKEKADTEWLQDAAAWDDPPAIVSGDGRILSNPAEAQVLETLPLTFFHFARGWAGLGWEERAWKAIKIWLAIVANGADLCPDVLYERSDVTKSRCSKAG